MLKPNWFPTLNDALNSEGLVETWNCFDSISYGETKQWNFELDGKWYHGSITRETNGMYERPVWYGIGVENE